MRKLLISLLFLALAAPVARASEPCLPCEKLPPLRDPTVENMPSPVAFLALGTVFVAARAAVTLLLAQSGGSTLLFVAGPFFDVAGLKLIADATLVPASWGSTLLGVFIPGIAGAGLGALLGILAADANVVDFGWAAAALAGAILVGSLASPMGVFSFSTMSKVLPAGLQASARPARPEDRRADKPQSAPAFTIAAATF